MAVVITVAAVRAKCGLDPSHDASIAALISSDLPALEHALGASWLESTDPGVVATLRLGLTEWLAGEYLAQLSRAPGSWDLVRVGELELRPPPVSLSDPSGLKAQGEARLASFGSMSSRPVVRASPKPVEVTPV